MDPTRLREEYMERAQGIGRTYIENSRVGFITLISGVKALPELVSFDPMGQDGMLEVIHEVATAAAAAAAKASP
ncbi:hypothetical protein ACFWIQ_24745 [Kitasatospora sp. NPDC127059]|uniref:hypothetical protein n=1 Tax=unclassified Kitasatospora TaxID=2633591 RepID=UPI0036550868